MWTDIMIYLDFKTCYNLIIEDNLIVYTRKIGPKLYTFVDDVDDVLTILSNLSSLDDESFKLLCRLKKQAKDAALLEQSI
jgi:hypothetical protein